MLWAKLDAEILRQGSENYDRKRKQLTRTYENNIVFKKLSTKITEFKDSIPLI